MTKKIEDGGPAFPHMAADGHPDYRPGLSRRDWFAGQALPAIIERCGADHRLPHEHITDYFARKAYEVADAMISARKGGEA
jgi:hypothetical protein